MDKIKEIVESFYSKAVKDVIIGYHFRKIQEGKSVDVLSPDISFFKDHIPRIVTFWKFQLLGEKTKETFNLVNSHIPLSIRPGELDRWLTLFHQTLDEFENDELIALWRERLSFFEKRFRVFI
ncbi:MAG: hypothetical protein DRQ88_10380 [Epsilonproteobacteria bacterium]|nr:MAG: hypothetical protein DRQ88_10380 [Campylobacterota bacterium]RLA65380.1 MAG: hypothetical protein DRQ89_01280 [Campylobacterota bacterium]